MYVPGINVLARRRKLKSALAGGFGEDLWWEVTLALCTHANETFELQLRPSRTLTSTAARNRQGAIESIKKDLRAGHPVLVCLQGALNHYSVICGYVGERLNLFDSAGLHWIQATKVGLGQNSRLTHWITDQSIIAIVDDW